MSRRAIVTPAAPPPAGTYSQAIRSNGPLVFSSRQTPRGLDGQRLVGRRLSNRRASLSTISRRSRAPADFRSDMP
jgi:enamine deaminase RidA (YjgF/YER057c/UK114 family)